MKSKVEGMPVIEGEQVALLVSESTTGIVLNAHMGYNSYPNASYLVFESIDEAQKFIDKNKRPNTDFYILNAAKKILFEKHFAPVSKKDETTVEKKNSKWWKFW